MSTMAARLRQLLDEAAIVYAGRPSEAVVRAARHRLDEPLRVAIAGRVKAGKSTLVNALIGEPIAATDAGECTRIVTWYRDGHTSRVTIQPRGGALIPTSFRRTSDGRLDIDLGDLSTDAVQRLVVDWPSQRLRDLTLVDTPGLSSAAGVTSMRAVEFLVPDDRSRTEVDAVIYLLRHVHVDDVRFLESFHDRELAHPTPVNTVGVLSRADEIGACRPDAMRSSQRIAERLRQDNRIQRLCQTVVPVAGLLAQAAAALTEDQVAVLRSVAAAPTEVRDEMLFTADRFVAEQGDIEPGVQARREVLSHLGLFGVRTGVQMLVERPATTAAAMAPMLWEASGIDRLRDLITRQFVSRAEVLKARSAARALEGVVARDPRPGTERLEAGLEAALSSAHEYTELRLMNLLRTGASSFTDKELADAQQLLGVDGTDAAHRLGLGSRHDDDEVRSEATRQLERWRRRAEHPLSDRASKDAAAVLVRTCEGLVADLGGPAPGPHGSGQAGPSSSPR